jgi:two-component system, LytTR family, sensor kinase
MFITKRSIITSLVYTILTYALIRLIDDPYADASYFVRAPYRQILLENLGLFLMSHLIYVLHTIIKKKYNKLLFNQITKKTFTSEILKAFLICLLVINTTALPSLTISFDGMQAWDVVEINIVPSFIVMLHYSISRANDYINLYIKNSVEMEKIKSEQLDTELKFLKSQIQPHFLFNALNTVYFQMDESVEGAKQTIEKLSNMLRYRLYGQNEEMTSLKEEFEYLRNYIDLQNTRYAGQLKLAANFDKSTEHFKIYPFLMLPLVENAFKYVSGKNEIIIQTKYEDYCFVFMISNSTGKEKYFNDHEGGIGIDNLRKRLQLLYPGKHTLWINHQNEVYTVILKLELHEN